MTSNLANSLKSCWPVSVMEASGCMNKIRYFPLDASATDRDSPELKSPAASEEPVRCTLIDKHKTEQPNEFSSCCWISMVRGIPGEISGSVVWGKLQSIPTTTMVLVTLSIFGSAMAKRKITAVFPEPVGMTEMTSNPLRSALTPNTCR